MRYFLELRYNGAAYCGWQRQPDMPSVQQTLERALTTLLREKIEVTGAGRPIRASTLPITWRISTVRNRCPIRRRSSTN